MLFILIIVVVNVCLFLLHFGNCFVDNLFSIVVVPLTIDAAALQCTDTHVHFDKLEQFRGFQNCYDLKSSDFYF
jgi:hypothetical protein